jgi:hypothetical protein
MSAHTLQVLVDEFSKVLANDPGPLDHHSHLYVHHLHGAGAEDVIVLLERAIRRSDEEGLYYFSGQRGTGKSTELKRLAAVLNGTDDTRAYIVDAMDYLSDTHPVDTVTLLLVIAIAFADRLSQPDALGHRPEPPGGLLKRFATWLQSEVEITGVTVGGVRAEFRKQQQSIAQRLQGFDLSRRERVMAECCGYISQMADEVRAHWQRSKVVLIVDSLERLRGVGSEAKDMFARIVRMFDGDLNQLRVPGVQMVYAVPPYLPYLTNVKALVRLFMLASVRVYEAPSTGRRVPRGSGVAAMRGVVERRFSGWREVISEGALDRLILASGGDMRQLLRRLLIDTLDAAYFNPERLPLAAHDEIIDTVIRRHEGDFENLVVRDEYALLKRIGEDNSLSLGSRDDLSVVAHFFDVRAVLNYRNGEDWLDLNPLLWPLIDGWTAPPSPVHEPQTTA